MNATRKPILGGIAVVVLLASAFFLFRSGAPATLPDTYTMEGVCLECARENRISYPSGQHAPHACPDCAARAVYPWMYCQACRKRFVPQLEPSADGPPRFPVVPACTACGSNRTGEYVPEDPEQKPSGTAPLPAFP